MTRSPLARSGTLPALLVSLLVAGGPLPAQTHPAAPPPPSAAGQEANALFTAGKFADAAKAYEAITRAEPQNPGAWVRLGLARHELGDYAGAAAALERGASLQPQAGVMVRIARAYARLGQPDKAFPWLEKAAAAGFANLQLLENDPDLASLRADARFAPVRQRVTAAAKPCTASPEFRRLDFWIGEWEQQNRDGAVVGSTSVQPILEQCVLLEVTTNPSYTAQAFHYYDPARKAWQQTYADTRAGFSTWTGEATDGEVRYTSEGPTASGGTIQRKSTFTRVTPDKVRQVFAESTDGGKTWTTSWDGFYVRKGGAK